MWSFIDSACPTAGFDGDLYDVIHAFHFPFLGKKSA
jgi:hypothetical protein